jgi:hypothetical protein
MEAKAARNAFVQVSWPANLASSQLKSSLFGKAADPADAFPVMKAFAQLLSCQLDQFREVP